MRQVPDLPVAVWKLGSWECGVQLAVENDIWQ
jgi:hypothetical protein